MKEVKTDLVVVGAGPAGLIAAKEAAEQGLDVTLLEKQYEIGYPIRTSGGSFIKDVKKVNISDKYYNKIKKFIFATKDKTVEFSFKEPCMCIMDVKAVYQNFAKEAMNAGVKLELGMEVRSAIQKNNFVSGVNAIKMGTEINFDSKITIDASGSSALIARQVNINNKDPLKFYSGAEYEGFVENLEKDTVTVIVSKEITPSGYAWIFPLLKDRARIGLALIKPDWPESPIKMLDDFVYGKKHKLVENLGKIQPVEIHAGIIPIRPLPSTSTYNGLMVIGDASGHPTPIAGEGIRLAMNAGISAAKVASRAIEKGDYSKRAFSSYEKESVTIIKNNKIGQLILEKMLEMSDEEWNDTAENIIAPLKKLDVDDLMFLLKGDFSKKTLLKIAAKNPTALAKTTLNLVYSRLK
jgi:digeranylgeranylglycerophospholipid reductase